MGTNKINVCVGVIWGRKGQSGYVRRAGQAGNWSVSAGLMCLPDFPMLHSTPVAQGFVNSLWLTILGNMNLDCHQLLPKARVGARGLDNAVAQCVMNPPCRTATHKRQSDAVYEGVTRCTERTGGSQITQLQPAFISLHEKDVQDGIDSCQQNPVPSAHSCLCLGHTLGTDNNGQALRLQETEQGSRYTRDRGGIWDALTCSMERESCLQTAGHPWDVVSSGPFLVSATSHSLPAPLKLLHAPTCLALTLLPAAFQLITPC